MMDDALRADRRTRHSSLGASIHPMTGWQGDASRPPCLPLRALPKRASRADPMARSPGQPCWFDGQPCWFSPNEPAERIALLALPAPQPNARPVHGVGTPHRRRPSAAEQSVATPGSIPPPRPSTQQSVATPGSIPRSRIEPHDTRIGGTGSAPPAAAPSQHSPGVCFDGINPSQHSRASTPGIGRIDPSECLLQWGGGGGGGGPPPPPPPPPPLSSVVPHAPPSHRPSSLHPPPSPLLSPPLFPPSSPTRYSHLSYAALVSRQARRSAIPTRARAHTRQLEPDDGRAGLADSMQVCARAVG